MSLDLAELDHNCNVVRRQIEEEFKNFTALFIVHRSGEREKTLLSKKNTILSKPNGRKVYDTISMTKNIHGNNSEFLGLVVNELRVLRVFKKRHSTAVFFINADEFVVDKNAKHQLYHMVWHALKAYHDALIELEKNKKGSRTQLFRAEHNELKISMHNLMADVFGALMMEIQGHEGYIQDLAEKRNKETLQQVKNINVDNFPYPVAYDACQFVYDDLKQSIDVKSKLINQIKDLSYEVASTYGKNSLKEWWSFSKPAQKMAWMEYTPEQILGTAIYTSEDTHVRALAYMIAESIDIETDASPEGVEYNPFIDDTINERTHNRVAEERFQSIFEQFEKNHNSALFLLEAKKQTIKLLQGIPTGWAAPALINAMQRYDQSSENNTQVARNNYYQTQQAIDWITVKKLSNIVIKLKKAGKDVNENSLIQILQKKNEYKVIVEALKEMSDFKMPDNISEPQETGAKQFVHSSYTETEKAG